MKFNASLLFSFAAASSLALSPFSPISIANAEPIVYDLGNVRPEGIHVLPSDVAETIFPGTGAPVALVSQVVYGGITAMNLNTGETVPIVPSLDTFYERLIWGLWYSDGAIFAAGGGPGVGLEDDDDDAFVHVFDIATGDLIVSCPTADDHDPSFLNDVAVLDGIAYLTDSEVNRIMTVDVAEAIQGNCVVGSIETPADIFVALVPGPADFRANGIAPYNGGIIISNSMGGIYFLDVQAENNVVAEILPEGSALGADGIAISGDDILYVVENFQNRITTWQLGVDSEDGTVTADSLGWIESEAYDFISTCAIFGDFIYAANFRAGPIGFPTAGEEDLSTFDETFSIVGEPLADVTTAPPTATDTVIVYDLGNVRPEGIHVLPADAAEMIFPGGSPVAIVSQVTYGGITALNLDTGDTRPIVPPLSFFERLIWGLWYVEGAILAAGGGPELGTDAVLHVFDIVSGALIVSCPTAEDHDGRFLNDVTVLDGIAYLTDSQVNRIMTVDVAEAVQGNCIVGSIETPADIFVSVAAGPVDYRANGIAPYNEGLIIVSSLGGVYFLDIQANNTVSEILPDGTTPGGDGIAIADGDILYVVENFSNKISAWQLTAGDGFVTADSVGQVESTAYDFISTCAISGDYIYAANFRAGPIGFPTAGEEDLSIFDEMFSVVGEPLLEIIPTEAPTATPVSLSPTAGEVTTPSPVSTTPPTVTPVSSTPPTAEDVPPTMSPTEAATETPEDASSAGGNSLLLNVVCSFTFVFLAIINI